MESDLEKFINSLNERISAKIGPLEQELNAQEDLIKELSKNLSNLSDAIQKKLGKIDLGKGKSVPHEEKTSEEPNEGDQKLTKDDNEEPKEIVASDS